jgi:hypothetical protein
MESLTPSEVAHEVEQCEAEDQRNRDDQSFLGYLRADIRRRRRELDKERKRGEHEREEYKKETKEAREEHREEMRQEREKHKAELTEISTISRSHAIEVMRLTGEVKNREDKLHTHTFVRILEIVCMALLTLSGTVYLFFSELEVLNKIVLTQIILVAAGLVGLLIAVGLLCWERLGLFNKSNKKGNENVTAQ